MTALLHRVARLLLVLSFHCVSYSQAFSTIHVSAGSSLPTLKRMCTKGASHCAHSFKNPMGSTERWAAAELRSTVFDFPLEVNESDCPAGNYLDLVENSCHKLGPLGALSQRVETSTVLFRRAYNSISNLFCVDTKQISRLGVGFGLSYAILSVINGSITLSVAWYLSAKRTGLSPLVPGQWKSLLGAYGTLYAFVQILKPFRVAAAIAMSNLSQKLLDQTQEKLNCSCRIAMAIQYAMGWMAWLMMSSIGICVASILSGTPVFGGIPW